MIADLFEDFPEIPAGWHELFLCMCQELLAYTKSNKFPEVKIFSAKEKYGELRVDVDIEGYSDETTNAIIDKWCKISRNICSCCGEPDARRSKGYVIPVCKNCWTKYFHRDAAAYEKDTLSTDECSRYPKEIEMYSSRR